jgi:flagellar motor switch protein FliN/FliY
MADEQDLKPQADAEVPEGTQEPVEAEPTPDADAAGESAEELVAADEPVVNDGDASEEDAEAAMMAMLEDLPQEESHADVNDIEFGQAAVSKAEFQHLSEPASKPGKRNIDLLMDVNLPISIELGRTKMSISDILALGPGSVVELNKLAGEPVDLLVNQKIVARGEVVVIDENFGVRITQLMTPEERLKSLGEES